MNIATYRLLNQQLLKPVFDQPKELVSWMGAMQARDYKMVRWAVGIRLKSGTVQLVDEALRKGELLRTHVMRPTWHLVAAEDIRWMLKLSLQRNRTTINSYVRMGDMELTEKHYSQSNDLFEKLLSGNKSLTKQEIEEGFQHSGINMGDRHVHYCLMRAEIEGVVCSGVDKGNKPTYALLEERVPPVKDMTKDEALARLAKNYFQSHSPASLQDFVWWSGLSLTEARQAIYWIESELTTEVSDSQTFYIHSSCRVSNRVTHSMHLLPPFDEYLISYKKRTDVLKLEHHPKAFTNNGIFYPVILSDGQVVGNWSRSPKNRKGQFEETFFDKGISVEETLLTAAKEKYISFKL